jgi:protein-S-isoprenylcysteine O-methyltransferase Ste14
VPLGFALAFVVLLLAHPTLRSLGWGNLVSAAGEAVRFWAAGHLEKGREVTRSGPYRWTAHPLYIGSSIIGAGIAIVSASTAVWAVVTAYLVVSLGAAVRTEEAELTAKFGEEYLAYQQGRSMDAVRRFSLARAVRNRELRAVGGLALALVLLALKGYLRL